MNFFKLDEANDQWVNIPSRQGNLFHWKLNESNGYIDLIQSIIQISKNSAHVPGNVCIATTMSIAFVLCQPKPPPPWDSKNAAAVYPPPPEKKPEILNLDEMKF